MPESPLTRPAPITEEPLNAEAPLSALRSEVTPTNLHFIRSHFPFPEVDGASWELAIGGAVHAPSRWSLPRLQKMESRSVVVTLECAGNGRTALDPVPEGTPWGRGAVSTARFTGVSLAKLLGKAEPRDGAVEVLFVGADEGETKTGAIEPYARSLDLETALHPDTIVAWGMNGDALLPEHGYPLRLVVPGWYGMASVKWLREISLLNSDFRGFFQVDDYVIRGCESVPENTPVSRIAVNSMIVSPEPGETLRRERVEIVGIAWSGDGPVESVEVSTDAGRSWTPATLGDAPSPWAHRPWRFEWRPTRPGVHTLAVRATDGADRTQPVHAPWNHLGYCNHAIQTVDVTVG
jgi:DMSO/TMAO reductase YedYZ molybdopterin-dependent catalytic subunit